MRIYEQIWGAPMRQETIASRRKSFKESVRDLMKDRGRRHLRFTSGRRIGGGLLFWLDGFADHASWPHICPLIGEVTSYILEGWAARAVSDSSSDSSDEDNAHLKSYSRGRLWR
ncbi:hypothetical protein WJX75_007731 [Coccomyxa subellipsoidea]|uniref:Uncharacterized protein n=1 Tax=Coccomyxa subellipsoidea TaxID=248742 RepID=A0ABR2YW66_9CHLO